MQTSICVLDGLYREKKKLNEMEDLSLLRYSMWKTTCSLQFIRKDYFFCLEYVCQWKLATEATLD